MIVNIKNLGNLITLDLRIGQIRFLKDYKQRGEIEFFNLSKEDIEGYEYLFKNDKKGFLGSIKEDLNTNLNQSIRIEDLEILEDLRGLK